MCTYLCHSFRVVTSVCAVSDVPTVIEHTSLVFLFLCHSGLKRYSYLLSYIVYVTLDYKLGATDLMTGNQCIMFSFTSVSNSVVLVDGSLTPIQGIDAATITPTLSLSFVFYLPCFPFNLLSVNNTKVLSCKWYFFDTFSIAWGEEDDWHGTWAEQTVWVRVGIRSGGLH